MGLKLTRLSQTLTKLQHSLRVLSSAPSSVQTSIVFALFSVSITRKILSNTDDKPFISLFSATYKNRLRTPPAIVLALPTRHLSSAPYSVFCRPGSVVLSAGCHGSCFANGAASAEHPRRR